jgi:hypothetical protein
VWDPCGIEVQTSFKTLYVMLDLKSSFAMLFSYFGS